MKNRVDQESPTAGMILNQKDSKMFITKNRVDLNLDFLPY